MTDKYTPTTKQIAEAWHFASRDYPFKSRVKRAEFNRWLANHDREVERDAAYKARQELIDACYDASTHLFGGQQYVSTAILESEAKRLGDSEARND
jgi:hypothetical protein